MEIKEVDINQIKPYFRNPRLNEVTIEYLKESIKKFGFNVPLVVDKNNVIITGHARYKALQQLGYKTVSVIVRDMTEKEAREYRIADNKIQEKTMWNKEFLRKELMDLGNIIGFDDEEIKEIVKIIEKENDDIIHPTMEQIKKTEDKLKDKFKTIVEKQQSKMIKFTCPHCLEEYEMTEEDIYVLIMKQKR